MPAPLSWFIACCARRGRPGRPRRPATISRADFVRRAKALLATQWGDYGLPPKQSAFALHALVAASYLMARGSRPAAPDASRARSSRASRRAGGAIRVDQEVTAIVIENGRAVGVDALDRRGVEPVPVRYRAPVVISDVGATLTYQRLLPTDGEIGRRTVAQRAEIASLTGGLRRSISMCGLRRRFRRSACRARTTRSTRRSITTTSTAKRRGCSPASRASLSSFPSAKSGDDRFHTAEVIAVANPEAFDTWRGTTSWPSRPRRRRSQAAGDVRAANIAERAVPGFSIS